VRTSLSLSLSLSLSHPYIHPLTPSLTHTYTGGPRGANAIASELRRRKVKAEFILDEGSMILRNAIPGCSKPIAFIANAEKGAMNIHLQVDCQDAGHSSQPPLGQSNVGILSKAISRLEANPFPSHMETYLKTLRFVASELSFPLRVVASNAWLFSPLLARLVLRKKSTAAMIRTTTAVTILKAGEKINSIPGVANAFVNHRIHPGDKSKENVLRYDRRVINDSRVKLQTFSFDGTSSTLFFCFALSLSLSLSLSHTHTHTHKENATLGLQLHRSHLPKRSGFERYKRV